jgi:hypothetical protein
LIGVIPKAHQVGVIEEFFELFKTPWEFYRPDRSYDVIIATANEIPEVTPRLLVIYGSDAKDIDARYGLVAWVRTLNGVFRDHDEPLPIYNEFLTFIDGADGSVSATSGIVALQFPTLQRTLMRVGYDLFDEVAFLLMSGQPLEYAHIPTLEIHIRMLREWILQAGVTLIEIPPTPANASFVACLTHDIDFVGIRNHRFDHSMWGFLYRATIGSLRRCLRGRLSLENLFRSWLAAASLPLVYAGWIRDFWEPFGWYLAVEEGLPVTYFLIPFKGSAGERVPGRGASRRAAAYDINEHSPELGILLKRGCELGVHGIDAWHSPDKGRQELDVITAITGDPNPGARIHWLLRDPNSSSLLEQAGFTYDSTNGYNETIGYRAGTSQVFRPLDCSKLLELPLHIQDGALFYPQRLDLPEAEAKRRCQTMIDNASEFGGVLTILWHDRSHGPERFWGDFYKDLIHNLRLSGCWFASARQVVGWYQKRRDIEFDASGTTDGSDIRPRYEGERIDPPLRIRVHTPKSGRAGARSSTQEPNKFIDVCWNGESAEELNNTLASLMPISLTTADGAL